MMVGVCLRKHILRKYLRDLKWPNALQLLFQIRSEINLVSINIQRMSWNKIKWSKFLIIKISQRHIRCKIENFVRMLSIDCFRQGKNCTLSKTTNTQKFYNIVFNFASNKSLTCFDDIYIYVYIFNSCIYFKDWIKGEYIYVYILIMKIGFGMLGVYVQQTRQTWQPGLIQLKL